MAIDLDVLQARIETKVKDGFTNPIHYHGDDLVDMPAEEAMAVGSPCRALRWLRDNSDYHYETFVELSDTEGWQGIDIFNKSDDTLHRTIKVKMGGGENANPAAQIQINNKTIIAETIDVIANDLDFDELETRLETKISDGRTNPIGYGGGSLVGMSFIDAEVMRSPCRALRWMTDNSAYKYITFVRLSDTAGSQGIDILDKGDRSLVREISVPMGGGCNADPKTGIYNNNKRIIMEALLLIHEDQ